MQKADAPLRKVTLNLYESDVKDIEDVFGWGWSEIVRNWIHSKVEDMRKSISKDGPDDYGPMATS